MVGYRAKMLEFRKTKRMFMDNLLRRGGKPSLAGTDEREHAPTPTGVDPVDYITGGRKSWWRRCIVGFIMGTHHNRVNKKG